MYPDVFQHLLCALELAPCDESDDFWSDESKEQPFRFAKELAICLLVLWDIQMESRPCTEGNSEDRASEYTPRAAGFRFFVPLGTVVGDIAEGNDHQHER